MAQIHKRVTPFSYGYRGLLSLSLLIIFSYLLYINSLRFLFLRSLLLLSPRCKQHKAALPGSTRSTQHGSQKCSTHTAPLHTPHTQTDPHTPHHTDTQTNPRTQTDPQTETQTPVNTNQCTNKSI